MTPLGRGIISSGKLGGAAIVVTPANTANLNGSNQYSSTANQAAFNFGSGDFTLSAWIKQTAETQPAPTIMSKWGWGTTNDKSYHFFQGGGDIYFIYSANGTAQFSLTTPWTPVNGTWYMVSVTRVGNDLQFYVDGSPQGSVQDVTGVTLNSNTNDFYIGTYADNSGPVVQTSGMFDGSMGFCGVWSSGLSAANILLLYNIGDARCYNSLEGLNSNLVSYWHLADFVGHTADELTDQHSSFDLTNNGAFPFDGTGLSVVC